MTASIPDWEPTWPFSGALDHVRITPSMVAEPGPWTCREQIAKKARPGVRPVRSSRDGVTYPPYATFPLGLARSALVMLLATPEAELGLAAAMSRAVSECREAVEPETLAAATAAAEGYLEVLERLRVEGVAVADSIVRHTFYTADQGGGSAVTEWWAWGLLHVSRDSQVRDFHLLRWGTAGARPMTDAALGIVARVAAEATVAADGLRWSERWYPAPAQPRPGARVRVHEIGVLDGSVALLLDCSVEEALGRHEKSLPGALLALAGGSATPGGHCAECAIRPECTALPRLRGVSGVIAHSPFTRRFSPSELVAARSCTWRHHLHRELHLPAEHEGSTAAQTRGSRVHRWLEEAHGRGVPCTAEDLPESGVGEVGERLGWDEPTARAVRRFLLPHLEQCPLAGGEAVAVFPEWTLTAWDTDADVVLTTRTDLVVDQGDVVVVRETKTADARRLPPGESDLLDYFPQVALAVCLVADGLDPVSGLVGPPRPGVVELELLTEDHGAVVRFSTTDEETVHQARVVLAELIDPLLAAAPQPDPGPHCRWCPVSRWCAVAEVAADEAVEVADPLVTLPSAAPSGAAGVATAVPHPLDVVLHIEPGEQLDDIPF